MVGPWSIYKKEVILGVEVGTYRSDPGGSGKEIPFLLFMGLFYICAPILRTQQEPLFNPVG